jgi:predicted O-methyltransferase YrrM
MEATKNAGRWPPVKPDPTFEDAWRLADAIPGWLTRDQARLLYDEATAVGPGATLLEIGSHQGRSTIVLATVARREQGQVIAVDPFVDGRLFGGLPTKQKFQRHVSEAGVASVVQLVEDFSTRARPAWSRDFDFLYIDGKHDYWTLSDDLRWSVHLPDGGPVLIHDCFSSIGVTVGVLRHVLFSQRLAFERRTGSMALFRVRRPSVADRGRILAQLPWWIRNVFMKVLLRLRLRPVARVFGHDSPYDPY